MINPNKYIKITGRVVSINHWLGDAVLENGISVDLGRLNMKAVHVGDIVVAEVNFRIVTDRY